MDQHLEFDEENAINIRPYHLDPIVAQGDVNSDSETDSVNDNGDVIPDHQQNRISNTEW